MRGSPPPQTACSPGRTAKPMPPFGANRGTGASSICSPGCTAPVADTNPAYKERAQRHLERARMLAPAREPFPAALQPPGDLASVPEPAASGPSIAGGGVELRWSPSPGAGYHQLARRAESGRWTTVLYAYGPDRQSFLASACEGCAHRIRACRTPWDCSAWAVWP